MRDVVGGSDRDKMGECGFEGREEFERFVDCGGTELVRKNNRTKIGILPTLLLIDEALVICIDLGLGGSRVKRPVGRVFGPYHSGQVESGSDHPDPIVDVTIRRAPAQGRDAEDVLDDSLGIVELGEDLFIGEGGHIVM